MQASSPARGDAPRTHSTPQLLEPSMPSGATQTSAGHGLSLDTSITSHASTSPTRPTWSPLTPTLSQADLPPAKEVRQHSSHKTNALPDAELPQEPLTLDENPDAIALRNAISILQIQRQQSIKDIQSLERLRQAALHDPRGFLSELKDNKLAQAPKSNLDVDAEASEDEDGDTKPSDPSKFGTIPKAQNVVRCPPVNWDKYHIVGESLDRLHEQQRRYPGLTEEQTQRSGHPPKHTIAAPYRPGIDRLDDKATPSQRKTL